MANEINFSLETKLIDPDLEKLNALVLFVLKKFEITDATVNFRIVNNDEILSANRQFLKHDYVTDVISFDLSDKSPRNFDIIVNGALAADQAQTRNHSPDAELALYICHGLLHNLGFDDQNDADAKKMHHTEDDILQNCGFGVVYNRNFKN